MESRNFNCLFDESGQLIPIDYNATTKGDKGDRGDKGDPGAGMIPGGTTGQALIKKSNTDYDTEWGSVASQEALTTESQTRLSNDTQLQTNINTEASSRQAADGVLQNNIETEVARAQAAEATKLDKMPGDEYTKGNAYNLPYFFYTVPSANKVEVHTKTRSLDGLNTQGDYSLDVVGATNETAGLMTAADKVALNNALPKMPGDEHTYGNPYNLPYYFETEAAANKVTVKAHTVTLDGNKTYGQYSLDVPSATNQTAGLMSAADKVSLEGKQDHLTAGQNITIENNVISATGGQTAGSISLTGWDETTGWHDGGTLTDAQAATLSASELNYIWLNGMHRLDFRYKDDNYNLATYSSNDGTKTHLVEVTLSNKTWRYKHEMLQGQLTAGNNITINNNVISASLNNVKTSLDSPLVAGTEYYIGEQTAVSLSLPAIAYAGDKIKVTFHSINTAASLSVSGTFVGTLPTPAANQRIELSFVNDGTYWAVTSTAINLV